MKKLIFTLGLALSLFGAQAQQYISLGPVVGFGHSGVTNGKADDNLDIQSEFYPSFNAGIGLIYAKHAHWGFGGEVLYAQEGFKKQIMEGPMNLDATQTAGYIRVPLRVYYFFGKYQQKVRPKVYAGPSFGFKITEDYKYEGNNDATKAILSLTNPEQMVDFNSFDLGIQAGIGVNITLAKAMWLNLDLNYYQGFLDAAAERDNNVFLPIESGTNLNQNLRFQVGVLFGLGKAAQQAE